MSPRADEYRGQKEWYKLLRAALVKALGARCALCGSTHDLEIDHEDGRDYNVRELSLRQRTRRYYEEYLAGVRLRVLCAKCNGTDGSARRWRGKAAVHVANVPF